MLWLKEQAFPSTESNTEQRLQTNAYTVLEAGFFSLGADLISLIA